MTSFLEFNCPHCEKAIRVDPKFAGQQGPCPHCNQTVTIQAEVGAPPILQQANQARRVRNTDANAMLAGLIALGSTLLLYGLIATALRSTQIWELFISRGVIPYVATFVTMWGLAILVLKFLAVRQEARFAEMELELLPLKQGMVITPENAEAFIDHLNRMPSAPRDSILGARIRGALEHFAARKSVPEVQSYTASQSEIDASTVDSGYTLLRAFIWAIPILGFIGTVMGISVAVSELAGSFDAPPVIADTDDGDASPSDEGVNGDGSDEAGSAAGAQITLAMKKVTTGLSVAFDTTFLALIMAIILLFPTESLKREEYAMLDRIDSFLNESLLRRLSTSESSQLHDDIAQMMQPAFKEHQRWLTEWQHQIADLGNVIGRSFEVHSARVQEQLERVQTQSAGSTAAIAETCANEAKRLADVIEQVQRVGQDWATRLEQTLHTGQQLQRDLTAHQMHLENMAESWKRSMDHSEQNGTENVVDAVRRLCVEIQHLNGQLANGDPGELIGPANGRRRWFSRS